MVLGKIWYNSWSTKCVPLKVKLTTEFYGDKYNDRVYDSTVILLVDNKVAKKFPIDESWSEFNMNQRNKFNEFYAKKLQDIAKKELISVRKERFIILNSGSRITGKYIKAATCEFSFIYENDALKKMSYEDWKKYKKAKK
jgi:hypothetical protein